MAVISAVYFAERSTRSAELNSTDSSSAAMLAPQGGTPGITQITLTTKDIVYDSLRNKIYASVPSNALTNANTVVAINPLTGQIEAPLTSGSNPGSIGLSGDGHYLYVGIDDAASIRRLDLQSQTQAPEFTLGTSGSGNPNQAGEIEVLPGQPESVAVSIAEAGVNHQNITIFDNGTPRPNKSAQLPQNDVIEFGEYLGYGNMPYGRGPYGGACWFWQPYHDPNPRYAQRSQWYQAQVDRRTASEPLDIAYRWLRSQPGLR